MTCTARYSSPLGRLILACDGTALTGVWFEGQKYLSLPADARPDEGQPVLIQAADWLDRYFAGERPSLEQLPLSPAGSPFRQAVWELLRQIPYGQVTTYKALAQTLAGRLGRETMSSQAVGGAVGHNPISVIIPCHRVVGTDGSLTGYAGGLDRKLALLRHEGTDLTRLSLPKTAEGL